MQLRRIDDSYGVVCTGLVLSRQEWLADQTVYHPLDAFHDPYTLFISHDPEPAYGLPEWTPLPPERSRHLAIVSATAEERRRLREAGYEVPGGQ